LPHPLSLPSFDVEWVQHGYIDRAIELLSDWALARTLADFDVENIASRPHTSTGVTVAARPGRRHRRVVRTPRQAAAPWNWSEGLGPTTVRRDDRLFARGVGDDGYSTYAALLAIEAMEANDIRTVAASC